MDRGRNKLYELGKNFNGNFDSLISDLKGFVNGFCNDNDFRRRLLSSSFAQDVNNNDKLYLFWKYENYLRNEVQPIFPQMSHDEFTNKNPRTKFSIEHIIPQSPKDSRVIESSSESILPVISQEFEEKHLHSVGNLTF